jgi:SAM-dependent methyltransferase
MSERNLMGFVVAVAIALSVAWSPVARGQAATGTEAPAAGAAGAADAADAADAPVKEVKKDVPYVPTPEPVVAKMIELAKVTPEDVAYDFGCGDGRLVIAAVKAGAKRGLGVDIDPQRIKEANENAKAAGVTDKVEFKEADLFTMDFKDATVLTMYLLPSVNMKLRPKILDEMKPGSRIVSHAFDMEDWQPEQEVTVEPGGQTVYMWTVPAKVEGAWNVKIKGGAGAQGEQQATLNLKQDINKVTGTAKIGDKEAQIADAKLVGDQLTFALSDQPDMKYTCKVEGSNISGTAKGGSAGGEAQLAGSKQGADASSTGGAAGGAASGNGTSGGTSGSGASQAK